MRTPVIIQTVRNGDAVILEHSLNTSLSFNHILSFLCNVLALFRPIIDSQITQQQSRPVAV